MSTETHQASDKENPIQSTTLGAGNFTKGKWLCGCNQAARCLTTKKSGANKGKKFWRCPKADDEQCPFFLWVEHEAAAKEWLSVSRLPPRPQTPTKTAFADGEPDLATPSGLRDSPSPPKTRETPFTKAKRKRPSRENVNLDDTDDHRDKNLEVNDGAFPPTTAPDDPFAPSHQDASPTRKAARRSPLAAPRQLFTDTLENRTLSLPTPTSRGRPPARAAPSPQRRLFRTPSASPTPGQSNNRTSLAPETSLEPDLASTVLELLRADDIVLKASTETQLRHQIGMRLDVGATRLRRYEETIAELRVRLDNMENMVLHLAG